MIFAFHSRQWEAEVLLEQMFLKKTKSFRNIYEEVLFCWEKAFSQLFFLYVYVGSELLYSIA